VPLTQEPASARQERRFPQRASVSARAPKALAPDDQQQHVSRHVRLLLWPGQAEVCATGHPRGPLPADRATLSRSQPGAGTGLRCSYVPRARVPAVSAMNWSTNELELVSSTCMRGQPWAAAARLAISSSSTVLPTPRTPMSSGGVGCGHRGRRRRSLRRPPRARRRGRRAPLAGGLSRRGTGLRGARRLHACLYHAVLPARCDAQRRP
jgi:hypothetical protein